MAVGSEHEETLVAGGVDVEKTSVTSWSLLFGGIPESGDCCVLGRVEKRAGVVRHMDSDCSCWAERRGWDSCTGVERPVSGCGEAQGGEVEDEEDSGVGEYDVIFSIVWLGSVSMLLSLMSTVIPL